MPKYSDTDVTEALAGRKAVRVYPFPSAEHIKVGVRMLSDDEMDGVRLEAQEYVKKKKCELVIDPEFFDRALHREVIARAFVDAEQQDEPFFSSMREVRELDPALVVACFELYTRHQIAMDPFAHCTREDVEELVDLLGKSPESEELSRLFDAPTLWSFVRSLALRLRETQQTPKSATG